MSDSKRRIEHAEALELIGYGLAKHAGSVKGKNVIANYISGSRSAFFQMLVDSGIATSKSAVSNRQDNYDPYFGTKRGYFKKAKVFAPRKARLDAVVGNLSMEEFAAFIMAIISDETGKTVSEEMQQLIRRAKHSLSRPEDSLAQLPTMETENRTGVDNVSAPTDVDDSESSSVHTKVQWLLKQLGIIAGCKVFIAKNDGSRKFYGEPLSKGCVEKLPKKGISESLIKRLSLIDVVWIMKNEIQCAFEVECSTSIYSGILRISDLVYSFPYNRIKGYIIVPEEREDKVIEQLKRPTFSNEHTQDCMRYMTIKELEDLYGRFNGLRPGSITLEVLEQTAHIVENEEDD